VGVEQGILFAIVFSLIRHVLRLVDARFRRVTEATSSSFRVVSGVACSCGGDGWGGSYLAAAPARHE